MTKIFVSAQPVEGSFRLGRDYKKRLIKVMRLKAGDQLRVFAGGKQYLCRIAGVHPDEVVLDILEEVQSTTQPNLHLTLVQAIPKGDRFEWLIQKATELGVAEIYPVITERSIVQTSHRSDKMQRWNEIAEQAAGQSENSSPPVIHAPLDLMKFLQLPDPSELKILLEERKQSVSLKKLLAQQSVLRITFVVGPEGGWTDLEREKMVANNFQSIHLGPRILRAETAGLVLATLLQYELGDFRSEGHADPDSQTSEFLLRKVIHES